MGNFSAANFISDLDRFYAREDVAGATDFLEKQYELADASGDLSAKLTILNEMTGCYRQNGNKEKGLKAIEEALALVEKTGNSATVSGGTIILNCATTLKSFGKSRESLEYYSRAERILTSLLDKNDPLLAGLFNNMALALQDTGDSASAEKYFLKAIEITLADERNALETAVSYVNLAHLLFEENPLDERVDSLMNKALTILENPRYFNYPRYAFTCRKCAPSFGYFGYFVKEKELNERADKAYAGN